MATQTVDVRVLSPSPEADGGITFSALSTSTTIGELKLKIKDELPSHPAPERMRIIYLGRVVMNETTLGAVLGEVRLLFNCCQSLGVLTLDHRSSRVVCTTSTWSLVKLLPRGLLLLHHRTLSVICPSQITLRMLEQQRSTVRNHSRPGPTVFLDQTFLHSRLLTFTRVCLSQAQPSWDK